MEFKVGDLVKTRLYGNKFLIEEIKKDCVIVSNEPYKNRSAECKLCIDLNKFKNEWYKVKR